MVKRSKSGRGDETKLITKAPCFLAYYPGEQYFYCDRSDPTPVIPDVSEAKFDLSLNISIHLLVQFLLGNTADCPVLFCHVHGIYFRSYIYSYLMGLANSKCIKNP